MKLKLDSEKKNITVQVWENGKWRENLIGQLVGTSDGTGEILLRSGQYIEVPMERIRVLKKAEYEGIQKARAEAVEQSAKARAKERENAANKARQALQKIFPEYDFSCARYKKAIKQKKWGAARDVQNYLLGMYYCMQLMAKETDEEMQKEVTRRFEILKK